MFTTLINSLNNIQNLLVRENEPMSKHTTFKIGGPARLFLEALTTNAAIDAVNLLRQMGINPFVIGKGSNLLISDCGINGVVLKLSCSDVSVKDDVLFTESGATLSTIATIAQTNGLSGLEFAHGIPGTVGGAITMNAGAYDGEISDVLIRSTCLSPNGIVVLENKDHNFSYRNSIYKSNTEFVILSAEFQLSKSIPEVIAQKMQELAEKRRNKQPLEYPSAGSVFKRPVGNFAGSLIEQCGLKGFSVGGAKVSEKHAGFIINYDKATANDVKKLIEHIQNVVLNKTGVSLECEICFK